jgi:hypothetical protein
MASLVLISAMLLPQAIGFISPAAPDSNLRPTSNPLTVWFDGPFQLTLAYPPTYEFNVAAKTAPGLSLTNLHWDFGDGATLDVPFSGQSQVSDVRNHAYSTQTNVCVTVTAYDNAGNVATVSQPLLPNYDFTINATQAAQNVTPGASATYNVAVGPWPLACGGGVSVGLSISSTPPAGITWTLNPSSGNTPFASTLQVQTSITTPKGSYTISIVGNSANLAHTTTVSLLVYVPYFTLSALPNSLYVPSQPNTQPSQMNTTTITVQSFNGFNSPVTLSVSSVPDGMTASFLSPTITPPTNGEVASVLTLTTPCSVTPGSYAITVQGTGGGITKHVDVYISVTACVAQSFDIVWWLLGGIASFLLLIPFLFILLKRQKAVHGPSTIPAAVVPVASVPPPMPCPVCGRLMRPVELRWYCDFCQRYIWIHPD